MEPTGYCSTCKHKEKDAFQNPCHSCIVLFQGMDQTGKVDNYQKEYEASASYAPSMAAQIAATCKTCLNLECHCTCEELQLSDIECSSDAEWLEDEDELFDKVEADKQHASESWSTEQERQYNLLINTPTHRRGV